MDGGLLNPNVKRSRWPMRVELIRCVYRLYDLSRGRCGDEVFVALSVGRWDLVMFVRWKRK